MTHRSTHDPNATALDVEEPKPRPQDQYRIRCPRLPLGVYREVAAHLRQVDGVSVGLLPQTSKEFDYEDSQVGGIWIAYSSEINDASHQQVEIILAHYSDRFGDWEVI